MSVVTPEPATHRDGSRAASLTLIDCDAHHNWRGVTDVLPYLPRYWADYVGESGFKALPNAPYPKGVGGGSGSMPGRTAPSARPVPTSPCSAASCSTRGGSRSPS